MPPFSARDGEFVLNFALASSPLSRSEIVNEEKAGSVCAQLRFIFALIFPFVGRAKTGPGFSCADRKEWQRINIELVVMRCGTQRRDFSIFQEFDVGDS